MYKRSRDPHSDRAKYIDNVINIDKNKNSNSYGCYLFRFFRMGEWIDVVIDDQLPLKIFPTKQKNGKIRRGDNFNPDDVDEWWALLLIKVHFVCFNSQASFVKLVAPYYDGVSNEMG